MTTKPLDRTITITPSCWRWDEERSGYLASFLVYGNVVGEPDESKIVILQGLRRVDPEPPNLVTLEHIIFNNRFQAWPPTCAMRFDRKGELRLVLADFKNLPLLVPGVLAEVTLFGHDPSHGVQIQPIFSPPLETGDELRWFVEHGHLKGHGWKVEKVQG